MSDLPARVVDRLAQRRIRPRGARPTVGGGDRTSGSSGAGMEFVEHRPYQPGDDFRHLDRHAYARFRAPFVKRFAADRGLDVTLLVDRSASMELGRPGKASVAASLAAGVASAVLGGGDRLRVGTFSGGGRVVLHRPTTGIGRLADVVRNIAGHRAEGVTDLARVAEQSVGRGAVGGSGITVVLSDWWTDDPGAAVRVLARASGEVVAVHLLSRDEEEPAEVGEGSLRLEEAETGDVLEVNVDASVHAAYRRALDDWRARLRTAVTEVGGRYLPVRSDEVIEQVLLQRWMNEGFIA
jgi:uncharacterized protein (DUF58 family)